MQLDLEFGKQFYFDHVQIGAIRTFKSSDPANEPKETELHATTASLRIASIFDLPTAFADLASEETVEGGTNTLRFSSLPHLFFVHLDRYQQNGFVRTPFSVPHTIDLKNFCTPDVPPEHTQYTLYAMVCHNNEQDPKFVLISQPKMDNNWLVFNEENVTPINSRQVGDASLIHKSFLPYLICLVRNDFIPEFTRSAQIPASLSPYLSSSRVFRITDYTKTIKIPTSSQNPENPNSQDPAKTAPEISEKCDKNETNDKTEEHNKNERKEWFQEKIVEVPIDSEDSFEKVIRNSGFENDFENDSYDLFAEFPGVEQIIKISTKLRANTVAIDGYLMNLYLVQKGIEKPVKLKNNSTNEIKGIMDARKVFDQYSSNFFFSNGDFEVKNPNEVFEHQFPQLQGTCKNVSLKIKDTTYEVDINASYEDLQRLVLPKKSPSKVAQIIFYAQISPDSSPDNLTALLPNVHKKVIQFANYYRLTFKILDSPATLYSLSMYHEISISLYGTDHVKETKYNLWVGNDQPVAGILSMIPIWFHKAPGHYAASSPSEAAIMNILEPDRPTGLRQLRVDVLKSPPARNAAEVLAQLEGPAHTSSIEVRTLSFEGAFPKFTTFGFYSFSPKTTTKTLFQNVSLAHPEVLQKKGLLLRGQGDMKNSAYQMTGKEAMGDVARALAKEKDWKNVRPYFTIQMTERPKIDPMSRYPA